MTLGTLTIFVIFISSSKFLTSSATWFFNFSSRILEFAIIFLNLFLQASRILVNFSGILNLFSLSSNFLKIFYSLFCKTSRILFNLIFQVTNFSSFKSTYFVAILKAQTFLLHIQTSRKLLTAMKRKSVTAGKNLRTASILSWKHFSSENQNTYNTPMAIKKRQYWYYWSNQDGRIDGSTRFYVDYRTLV